MHRRFCPPTWPEVTNLRQTAAYTATAAFPEDAAADVTVTPSTTRRRCGGHFAPLPATKSARRRRCRCCCSSIPRRRRLAGSERGLCRPGASPSSPSRRRPPQHRAGPMPRATRGAGPGKSGRRARRRIGDNRPVALGGNFSSAVLAQLLRAAGDDLAGWVTLGGLANAFTPVRPISMRASSRFRPPTNLLVPALGRQPLPAGFSRLLAGLLCQRTAADHDHPHRGRPDPAHRSGVRTGRGSAGSASRWRPTTTKM